MTPDTRPAALLACLFLILGSYALIHTAGFLDLAATQKRDTEPLGPLDRGHIYVQQFTPERPFLSRIDLKYRSSGSGSRSTITLRLREAAGEQIAARTLSIPGKTGIFPASLLFSPQNDSARKVYELAVETDAPSGAVSLMGSDYDAYPQGGLSRNGLPLAQDIGFSTYSRPDPFHLIAAVLRGSSSRLASLLLITLLFGGLCLCAALALTRPRTLIELAAYAAALGAGLPPVLLFLLSAAGLHLTRSALLLALILLLAAFAASGLYARRREPPRLAFRWQPRESMLLLVLLAFALFTRLAQIDDLLVPSGTGGLAHQRILQRIDSRQSIPLDSVYHTGFHSNVFLLHQITGLELPEAALIFGQWLSAVSGLPFYLLARRLLKQPPYALAAAAAWWFLAPIPALLLNWSRYPFLQGLVILPVALTFLVKGSPRPGPVMAGLLLAGLFLSHYGVFAVFCLLAIAAFLSRGPVYRMQAPRSPRILVIGAVIFLPVLIILIARSYALFRDEAWPRFLASAPLNRTAGDYAYFLGHTFTHGGPVLWLMGALGFVLLCVRSARRRSILIASLAVGLALLLLDAAQMLVFRHSASRPVNTLYLLSVPLCILTGFTLKALFQRPRWLTPAFILFALLAGGYNISGVADSAHVFFTAADAQAMDWIRAYTPPDAVFLVNSYPYDGNYQPEDGGGWIPYLTGRRIIFLDSPAAYEQPARSIEQAGADYIYIGSGYGPLAFPVTGDPHYPLLYARAGRFIYQAVR